MLKNQRIMSEYIPKYTLRHYSKTLLFNNSLRKHKGNHYCKEGLDNILICKHFGNFILLFSLHSMISLRSYLKHSKVCSIRHQKTLKWVKKTQLRLVFTTHFSVFGNHDEHSSSCFFHTAEDKQQPAICLLIPTAGLLITHKKPSQTMPLEPSKKLNSNQLERKRSYLPLNGTSPHR